MIRTQFLISFIVVVVCQSPEERPVAEDDLLCEGALSSMDSSCPEGNRCLTRTRDAITCALDRLNDILSMVQQDNLTDRIDKKIEELQVPMNRKMLKLEEEMLSLKRQLESKEISSSAPASAMNEEKEGVNETSPGESPCMYVARDGKYFVTPHMAFAEARQCCYEHGGIPFVPKTQEDYVISVVKVTAGVRFGWLPINDLEQKEDLVWEDGTKLEDGPLKLRFTSKTTVIVPGKEYRCIGVSSTGTVYRLSCDALIRMLCVQN